MRSYALHFHINTFTLRCTMPVFYFEFHFSRGDVDGASTVPGTKITCWVCLDGHTPLKSSLLIEKYMSVPLIVSTLFDQTTEDCLYLYHLALKTEMVFCTREKKSHAKKFQIFVVTSMLIAFLLMCCLMFMFSFFVLFN